jgi:hypothetical protein
MNFLHFCHVTCHLRPEEVHTTPLADPDVTVKRLMYTAVLHTCDGHEVTFQKMPTLGFMKLAAAKWLQDNEISHTKNCSGVLAEPIEIDVYGYGTSAKSTCIIE